MQPSSLPEWVHQIIEIWSLLSEDPGARFLDLIKEAPEIANSDDPDSEARDKLGEMISNVVECLISDDDDRNYYFQCECTHMVIFLDC